MAVQVRLGSLQQFSWNYSVLGKKQILETFQDINRYAFFQKSADITKYISFVQ